MGFLKQISMSGNFQICCLNQEVVKLFIISTELRKSHPIVEELGGIAHHCINKTSQNEKGIEKYIGLLMFQLNHVNYIHYSKQTIDRRQN